MSVDPIVSAIQSSTESSIDRVSESRLFEPIRLGTSELSHRIVLAPLTRFRADKAHVPTDLHVEYYAQRASVPGTHLITEATFVSANAGGLDNIPGIWNDAQISGWKKVVDAVHARKSTIYLQLWSIGRGAFADILAAVDDVKNPGGPYPYVSASNIPLSSRPATDPAPRPLTHEEIEDYIEQYGQAAKNAIRAGFDGVEINAVHGFLIDQFIQTNSNKREDQWGAGVKGRSKFALAVVDAVASAIGPEKTAVRFSPWSTFQDMRMSLPDTVETFSYLVRTIRNKYPTFSYLHVPEPRASGLLYRDPEKGESNGFLKDIWLNEGGKDHNRVYVAAGGYTVQSAVEETEARDGVVVAFGRHFLANPDLVARIKKGIPLTPYNRDLFYTPETPLGYIDYEFADKEAELHHQRAGRS